MGSNCEAYKPKNPLPYRRLKEYANGIWDETRREFYKYNLLRRTTAGTMLQAKKGIRYFIKSVSMAAENNGDNNAGSPYLTSTMNGATVYFGECIVSKTVAASNVNASCACEANYRILLDPGSAITLTVLTTSAIVCIIYAEIPDDPAGGLVVVS